MQTGVESAPGCSRCGLHWLIALSCCLASFMSLSACTGFRSVVPAPLVFEEQSAKILELAPLGTPKEQAIRQLNDAGISGDFASSPSIYYCDLWQREDGSPLQVSQRFHVRNHSPFRRHSRPRAVFPADHIWR